MEECIEYGYCAIDTEGTPASLIQMSSARGLVVYWSPPINNEDWFKDNERPPKERKMRYDWSGLPKAMRDILKDVHIIKIQSGIFTDVKWLEKAEIQINSVVELQILYQYHKSFVPGGKRGMEQILTHACGQTYVSIHYDTFWKASKIHGNKNAMKHMCQDVRGAILGLYEIVTGLFEEDGGDNMMPLLQQILFMHLSIDPRSGF